MSVYDMEFGKNVNESWGCIHTIVSRAFALHGDDLDSIPGIPYAL